MIRGLYSAATGLAATTHRQDVAARNLSNAGKPGFRRHVMQFESFGPRDINLGTNYEVKTDFTPGDHRYTGADLDVALVGDGFFVVNTPQSPLYTRDGSFHINRDRQLVTFDGHPVQGTNGPTIIIPDNTKHVSIDLDGNVHADGEQVGTLRTVQFADNDRLTRAGNAFFQAPPDMPPQDAVTEVRQGYREQSNGPLVTEMVSMIFGLRHFEASQRALRALSDVIQFSTRPN